MINFDDVVKENIKEHNPNWPQIPNHPYRILIIGSSGSGKANSLSNLINQQQDIDKIYLYAKDSYKAKYQKENVKMLGQSILKILSLLLNNQIIWIIFIKTLKNSIEIET